MSCEDDIVSDTTLHDVPVNVQLRHSGGPHGYYFQIGELQLTFAAAERVCDVLRAEMSRIRAYLARQEEKKI